MITLHSGERLEIQFFFRKDTLQIDAVYLDCTTNISVWKDTSIYTEVNVVDPPYTVNRDHKVILTDNKVTGTTPSTNPVQPAPAPNPNQDLINLLSDPSWGSGIPTKIEIVRIVLLKLLET